MELRHLRYFVTLAEERNFGKAAKRLHMAQPPLSRAIHDLENELGLVLFDRAQRPVALTAAGSTFLSHSRRVFEALELAVKDAKRANAGETGRVAVGYPSSLAYSGITELLRAFKIQCPAIDLTLREMPPQEQIDAIKDRRIDVGFVRAPIDDASLDHETIRRELLVVALPSDHPLAARKRIALRQLSKEPFVFFPRHRGPAFFDQLMRLCHDAGFLPRIVQEAPQLDLLSLVAAGFGVSIVPSSMRHIARTGLSLRPIVGSPTADLLIAWRTDEGSPAVAQFLAFVRRVGVGGQKTARKQPSANESHRASGRRRRAR